MRKQGTEDRGQDERGPFLFSLVLCLLIFGCAKPATSEVVWIDVDRLVPTAAPARVSPPTPRPPAAMPGKTAGLPARPAARLVSEAGIDGEALAHEVDAAQAASLSRLRARLIEVYGREADRFARAQLRLLGDPYRKAIDAAYPAYRRAFEAYAAKRVVPSARLAYIVGPRDPNPHDEAIDTKALTPLARLLAARASAARRELKALDEAFKGTTAAFLTEVDAKGDAAKADVLTKIANNRDVLNRQAIAEALTPIGPRGEAAIRLSLARAGFARVPAVAARSLNLPAVPAPAPPPRVESPKALVDARARLLGEARIWAAGAGLHLDPKGRDATSEFVRWKTLRAGALPTSPPSSTAP